MAATMRGGRRCVPTRRRCGLPATAAASSALRRTPSMARWFRASTCSCVVGPGTRGLRLAELCAAAVSRLLSRPASASGRAVGSLVGASPGQSVIPSPANESPTNVNGRLTVIGKQAVELHFLCRGGGVLAQDIGNGCLGSLETGVSGDRKPLVVARSGMSIARLVITAVVVEGRRPGRGRPRLRSVQGLGIQARCPLSGRGRRGVRAAVAAAEDLTDRDRGGDGRVDRAAAQGTVRPGPGRRPGHDRLASATTTTTPRSPGPRSPGILTRGRAGHPATGQAPPVLLHPVRKPSNPTSPGRPTSPTTATSPTATDARS